MFGLNPWIILGVVVAFVGFGFVCNHHGHTAERAAWVALEAQRDKLATDKFLASEAARQDTEKKLQSLSNQLEHENVESQKRIDGLRLANGRLLDAACGLYDKNGRPLPDSGANQMSADPGAPRSAQGRPAACEFPATVRALLADLRDDLFAADQAAIYAAIGHRYAISIAPLANATPSP